ncbi:centromere protein X isoform X1 [Heterocephalus glaber]|uniref:Centromere protein X n=1 Tax=Heterocephalus glaber TaxID=10181 RepID=A0AAX6RIQ0_HETGA|nr:centromere protein X isoform X1 [Heterocephalus glaber]
MATTAEGGRSRCARPRGTQGHRWRRGLGHYWRGARPGGAQTKPSWPPRVPRALARAGGETTELNPRPSSLDFLYSAVGDLKQVGFCPFAFLELVSRLLHLHFKDDKTKVSGDALQLMAELLRIFVVEAAVRGVRQAQAEDTALVDVDQLEKVLPQLLLDF